MNEERKLPPVPTPPPGRLICDACGPTPLKDGKHRSWICRFLVWLDLANDSKR